MALVVLYINPKTQSLCYYIMFLCKKVFVLLHHVPMQDTSICVLTACSYARHSLCVVTSYLYTRHGLCVVMSHYYATIYLSSYKVHDA